MATLQYSLYQRDNRSDVDPLYADATGHALKACRSAQRIGYN